MRYLRTRRGLVALGVTCAAAAVLGFTLGSLDAPEVVHYLVGILILVPAIVYAMGGRTAFRRPPGDQAARNRRSAGGA